MPVIRSVAGERTAQQVATKATDARQRTKCRKTKPDTLWPPQPPQNGKRPQRRMGAIHRAYYIANSKHAAPLLAQVRESIDHYNERHTSPATQLATRLEIASQLRDDAIDVAVVINAACPANTIWLSRPEGHAEEGWNA